MSFLAKFAAALALIALFIALTPPPAIIVVVAMDTFAFQIIVPSVV
jgi:hypothetical protein